MTISKGGRPITDLDDWFKRAGPKAAYQWKDHRSAKEAARAWLGDGSGALPIEIADVLNGNAYFGRPTQWTAEPEARLHFDGFAGEPRNSDLVVYATDAHGDYVLAVEAKADETFGPTVGDALAAAIARQTANPRSNGVRRIEQLAAALFPSELAGVALLELRYQLLTATAGALCEAQRRGASRTVLLIHEFVTVETVDEKHAANKRDLDGFVRRLGGDISAAVTDGCLLGPFSVPGRPLIEIDVQLFIGKATRNLRKNHVASST